MDLATEQVIAERLQKGLMSGKAMLSTFRMIEEVARHSPAYSDPRYAPFYYILGKERPVTSVLEIGFGIGIASGCYVRGCQTVQHLLTFQESGKNYYSPRIGIHNVKSYVPGDFAVHVGKIADAAFVDRLKLRKWELGILNDEKDYDTLMLYLDVLWDNLAIDGTLIVEYVRANETVAAAYGDFCKRKSRAERILHTKYGVGVMTK